MIKKLFLIMINLTKLFITKDTAIKKLKSLILSYPRYMNKSGEVVETTKFHPGQSYTRETEVLGLELGHERSTSLGHNIYAGRSSG